MPVRRKDSISRLGCMPSLLSNSLHILTPIIITIMCHLPCTKYHGIQKVHGN